MQSPIFKAPLTNPFGLVNIGGIYGATVAIADLDADGDLDILAGNGDGDLLYFSNQGSKFSPNFNVPIKNPFGLTNVGAADIVAPAIGDLDGDGDFDVLVGNESGNLWYFRNTGNSIAPNFAAAILNPFGLTQLTSRVASPTLVDLDADGDLDALIGADDSNFYYFKNIGTTLAPSFNTSMTNPFGLSNIGSFHSAPNAADLDADGDLDILAGLLNGDLKYFQNIGSAASPLFSGPLTNPFNLEDVGTRSIPALKDLDSDGDLDALIGNGNANFTYFENENLTASFTLSLTASITQTVSLSTSVTPNSGNTCATATIESVTNKLTVKNAETVVFSNKNLEADLPGCTPDEIKYTVEQVSHGQFERTKGKLGARDKDAITAFTQADVDAGAISFEHDGSNQKPSYTLDITNGVVSQNDKGDIKFIPEAQKSKARTAKPTAKPSHEDSAASKLSVLPEISTSLMLGVVLAKMGLNAVDSLVSAGKRWWQGKTAVVNGVSTMEHKHAQACFDKLQGRIEHLLRQGSLEKWYRYGLEDLQDELTTVAKGSISLVQVKEWQAELGELEADYAPVIAQAATVGRIRSNSFFKPAVQQAFLPEQAALPAIGIRQIAA